MKAHGLAVVSMLSLAPISLSAQGATNREGVRRAALDYIEGFYEGDTAKIVRSVSPEVVKFGYFRKQGESSWTGEGMPWSEFLSYTQRVKARGRPTPPTAPKEVIVLDVADKTAAAKVIARWGTARIISAIGNATTRMRPRSSRPSPRP